MGPKAEARADATADRVRHHQGLVEVAASIATSESGTPCTPATDGFVPVHPAIKHVLTNLAVLQMKAEAKATPAEDAGTSMSLKARADVLEQGFFDEKAEWNYARNVEVRRPAQALLLART